MYGMCGISLWRFKPPWAILPALGGMFNTKPYQLQCKQASTNHLHETKPAWHNRDETSELHETMRLHNRGQSHKLWSCFLLGLRRFGLLQPALWLGGRTRAIASSQRCPGVSYTHAWPMPLSIRLGLFWSNFWEKPEPPNGKTLYLGSHVSKKGQLFCPWNARWHLR